MTRKKTWVRFAVAVVLSLSLTACKDTKTLQQDEALRNESFVGVKGLGSFETRTWFGMCEPVSVFIVRKGRLGG